MNNVSFALKEMIIKWESYLQNARFVSSHTFAAYQTDLRQFINFFVSYLGKPLDLFLLQQLKNPELRAWLASRHQQAYNARSTARSLSSVKSFFRFLQKEKAIEDHPLLVLQSPRLQKTLPRPLSIEQALDVLENIGEISDVPWVGQRDKALFTLIYSAGLRISEALSLNHQDIQTDQYLTIRGKGGKYRKVPFLPMVRQQIEAYIKILPFLVEGSSPLFLGIKGKRLDRGVAETQMRRYRYLAGMPDSATPHAFRHSCATHLMSSSGDLRAVQELLGHASLSTTQIYTEVDSDYLMKAYQKAHPRGKSNT